MQRYIGPIYEEASREDHEDYAENIHNQFKPP